MDYKVFESMITVTVLIVLSRYLVRKTIEFKSHDDASEISSFLNTYENAVFTKKYC